MPILPRLEMPGVSSLDGFHLFHYAMSSCSQRVRFALAEANIDWQSHHIDLSKMEQTEASYQRIHPKGYVPALVHDDRLIIESNDIITYISQWLGHRNEALGGETKRWLDISDQNQNCLKLITYEILFKPRGHFSKESDVEHYLANQKNPELRQFLIEFVNGFSPERVQNNIDRVHDYLALLDSRLSDREYLSSSQLTDADIANVVNVHRYNLCDFDLKTYVHLYRWYTAINNRPAFTSSIMNWQQ